MTLSYTDATVGADGCIPVVLWHPGLSLERVDQLAVTSYNLVVSDRSRIAPGLRRVHFARNDYQPYVGTVTTQIHGLGDFKSGKIYFAHQNLGRGRLEIVELPDDFKLPQSKVLLLDPSYEKSLQLAEKIHRASVIPSLSLPTNEIK